MIQLCGLVLSACLVLGGSTYAGFLSDVVIQLAGIPLLMFGLWRMSMPAEGRGARSLLALCAAIIALPVAQLIPLPPAIWSVLPGRGPEVEAFALIHRDLPWMPLSVTPRATWLSALALIAPMAIVIGTLQLSYVDRRRLALVVLGVGMADAVLGLMQVAQGPLSPLRFYPITNDSEAVGFFANRNHFAALLYCLVLMVVPFAVEAATPQDDGRKGGTKVWQSARVVPIVASVLMIVVVVATQAMTRSRAGLGLTIVALFGALVVAASDRRTSFALTPVKLIGVGAVIALTFTVQLTLYRVLDRFGGDPLDDARVQFAQRTVEAAKTFMPFGAGLGSFVQVYPLFERPQDALIDVFANRAHNDILEFWLEAGAWGLVLMLAIAAWLAFRFWKVWGSGMAGAASVDHSMARAASVIVLLLVCHSIVDYPLRTEAMLAIIAFVAGLLVEAPEGRKLAAEAARFTTEARSVQRRARLVVPPVSQTETPVFPPMPLPVARQAVAQGGDVEWPTHSPLTAAIPIPGESADSENDWPAEWRKSAGDELPSRASADAAGSQPMDWPPSQSKRNG